MPNPRDQLLDNLNQQLDHFFGSGGKAQQIPSGVTGDPRLASTPHHDRLRVERNKIAPKVRELAEAGKTISETAKTLHMHVKRVALIASENGLKFNS
jgi:ActR/RegA family two-component response regulator